MKQTLLFILSRPPSVSLSNAALDAILTSLLLDQAVHVVLMADAHKILTTLDLAEKIKSFQSLGEMSVYRLNTPQEFHDNLSNNAFGTIEIKTADINVTDINATDINAIKLQQIIAGVDKVINF